MKMTLISRNGLELGYDVPNNNKIVIDTRDGWTRVFNNDPLSDDYKKSVSYGKPDCKVEFDPMRDRIDKIAITDDFAEKGREILKEVMHQFANNFPSGSNKKEFLQWAANVVYPIFHNMGIKI